MNTIMPTLLMAASNVPPMVEKLAFIRPEIALFVATVVVMIVGLSPKIGVRRLCAPIAVVALVIAGFLATNSPVSVRSPLPELIPFAKTLIAAVGVLLVMLLTGTVDRGFEASVARGVPFDGIKATRAEFYAFTLFSLMGLMLVTTADDLIWLFLALELTSLPTYVMVSISTARSRSQEAGVKYFFLGALGAAMFLYGFTLLYGATGTTVLFGTPAEPGIMQVLQTRIAETGSIGTLATLGMIVAIVGVSFKIAAVPMHFYTPDVYEGAATSVSAFLAFVPKTAGFVSLILLLSTIGWGDAGATGLPEPIRATLWVMAAMSMTVGNVLAILQRSVKRILAYSSIAHTGYMLVGLVTGPGSGSGLASNGIGATLFYLLCYSVMNLGAFAVLACIERGQRNDADGSRREIETVDDLRGLCSSHPLLGWTMILCSLSLLGMPPLLGFFGKLFLFTSALAAGEITLVVVMGLNSAIAAFYYLRLVAAPYLEPTDKNAEPSVLTAFSPRIIAAVLSAAGVVLLVFPAGRLMSISNQAGKPVRPAAMTQVENSEQRPASDHSPVASTTRGE